MAALAIPIEQGVEVSHQAMAHAAIVHGFMDLYVDALHRWALWALKQIEGWRDTAPDADKLIAARALLLTPVNKVGATAGRHQPNATPRRTNPRLQAPRNERA